MPKRLGISPGTHTNGFKRAQATQQGVTQGGNVCVQPGANVCDLEAILAGDANKKLAPATVTALYTYLHILTCVQRTKFNLWRAQRIYKVQAIVDKQWQFYSLLER